MGALFQAIGRRDSPGNILNAAATLPGAKFSGNVTPGLRSGGSLSNSGGGSSLATGGQQAARRPANRREGAQR